MHWFGRINIHETKSRFPQPSNVFALVQVHFSISHGYFSSLVPQVSFEVCPKYLIFLIVIVNKGFSIIVSSDEVYTYIYNTLNTNSLRGILVSTSLQLILLFDLICFLELSKNKWLCEGFKLWFMSRGS